MRYLRIWSYILVRKKYHIINEIARITNNALINVYRKILFRRIFSSIFKSDAVDLLLYFPFSSKRSLYENICVSASLFFYHEIIYKIFHIENFCTFTQGTAKPSMFWFTVHQKFFQYDNTLNKWKCYCSILVCLYYLPGSLWILGEKLDFKLY
jgi:hypothetical protein